MLPSYDHVAASLTGQDAWEQVARERDRAVRARNRHAVIGWVIAAAGAGLIAYALGTTSLAAALDDPGLEGYFFLFLLGIVVILCSLFYVRAAFRRTRKRFSRIYKKLIVPPLVESMAGGRIGCTYRADGCISATDLLAFPIFRKLGKADLMSGEDHFTGTIGGAGFQLCEISAKVREYENEYTRKDPLFTGLVLIADFRPAARVTIVIESRKGIRSASLPRWGEAMDGFTHDFDREFRVWTTSERAARDLLQGEWLEKLVRLREQFPKQAMNVCLHDGKLALAIHGVDLLEAKGLKHLEDEALRSTYDDMRSIFGMVKLSDPGKHADA